MAKKEEKKLSFLQMPLPSATKHYRMAKRSWVGLNYRQTIDTGALSMESNISTLGAPYLIPSEKHEAFAGGYENPIGIFGFGNFLIVIYRTGSTIKLDYIVVNKNGRMGSTYTGVLRSNATVADDFPRCIVQFNVYNNPANPVESGYTKKLLIFPDKKSMDFEITGDNFTISDMGSEMPNIKYATVHLSRLFGVDDGRVYASGFNDYTNWMLDTADEYNESNAWCSPAQSTTKASGNFTGITLYQNHIVCFKRDFMHEIYNTKNPFRIQDVYEEGTIDNRTIQNVDGKLIFVSEDDVKVYTGANPRIIGYYLNISQYTKAVSGTDNRCYYLYCEDETANKRLFVYDTYTEQWSEQEISRSVVGFAHNENGMFMLCDDGVVYKMDTGVYDHPWSFETDLITNNTVDIKHLKKIQMLADVAEGAGFQVYVLYDDEPFDENTSHLLYSSVGSGQKTVRVKPRQSANYGMKIHMRGFGYVKLYEMELLMEAGGDLYV